MKLALIAAVPLALAVAAPASAAQFVFDFSPSQALFGPPVSGSGTFTTSDGATTIGGRTAFQITSITGTVNGSQIVAPTGNYGNYFTTGPAFLDGSGLRFFTQSGIDVRFFFQDTVSRYRVNTFGAFGSSEFVNASSSPATAAVPEPATWALMLIGFGAVGFALRRQKRPATARLRAQAFA
ncbi:MAG: hypothetical protein B7Z08_01400 [Sphingomonadales bacterium 32-68-7]|nr:MAG: hypothetical protein B7Z33_08735 [Sphingomonadales bacterium 12-68-11]OYX10373.1 MAG: hypothetical protein B7Z08_01400 [Sphingomonadales bacterium 32-68-7]